MIHVSWGSGAQSNRGLGVQDGKGDCNWAGATVDFWGWQAAPEPYSSGVLDTLQGRMQDSQNGKDGGI